MFCKLQSAVEIRETQTLSVYKTLSSFFMKFVLPYAICGVTCCFSLYELLFEKLFLEKDFIPKMYQKIGGNGKKQNK